MSFQRLAGSPWTRRAWFRSEGVICNDDVPEVLSIFYTLFSPFRCESRGDWQVLWSNQRGPDNARRSDMLAWGVYPDSESLQFIVKTDSGSGFGLPNCLRREIRPKSRRSRPA